MNIELQKQHFKDHVATFTDHGNIRILDFKNPKSCNYRIRFLFEEDYCRLHISGDLGELIATNYNNMTYDGFSDYVNNTGYFEGKIDCMSRTLYEYDIEKAREYLRSYIRDQELEERVRDVMDCFYADDDMIDAYIEEVLTDFDDRTGIGRLGYERLENIIYDVFEFAGNIGKENTGILELYMLAFKLAQEQLRSEDNGAK